MTSRNSSRSKSRNLEAGAPVASWPASDARPVAPVVTPKKQTRTRDLGAETHDDFALPKNSDPARGSETTAFDAGAGARVGSSAGQRRTGDPLRVGGFSERSGLRPERLPCPSPAGRSA